MAEKKKVLLIDDDSSLLVTLGDFLGYQGYDVTTADSGEEGLRELKTMTPDLIILDMSMPGMGGLGFLENISSAQGGLRYPVLVLTARAQMAESLGNVAVDGFVAKPCDPNDLLMEVNRIVFLRGGTAVGGAAVEGAGPSVLLAEADDVLRAVVQKALEDEGFTVDAVSTGPELIERAILAAPDVVLLSRAVGSMRGDDVAGMLRDMPRTNGVPVVLYGRGDDVLQPERAARYVPLGEGSVAPVVEVVKEVLGEGGQKQ